MTFNDVIKTLTSLAGNMILMRILIGIVILIVGWLLANFARKLIWKFANKFSHPRYELFRLAGSIVRVAIIVVSFVVALGTMGVNVSALIAGLGLGGFAFGFALKDILSNILAGVLILVYQPFAIGDNISVKGCTGKVTEMNLRYTTIDGESEKFLVPNSVIYSSVINLEKASAVEEEQQSANPPKIS